MRITVGVVEGMAESAGPHMRAKYATKVGVNRKVIISFESGFQLSHSSMLWIVLDQYFEGLWVSGKSLPER
jgi:hypothetical protein